MGTPRIREPPLDDVIRSEMAGTGRSDEPWIPQLLTTERFHPLDRDPGSGQWAINGRSVQNGRDPSSSHVWTGCSHQTRFR